MQTIRERETNEDSKENKDNEGDRNHQIQKNKK
jgi:hypothetical protein